MSVQEVQVGAEEQKPDKINIPAPSGMGLERVGSANIHGDTAPLLPTRWMSLPIIASANAESGGSLGWITGSWSFG